MSMPSHVTVNWRVVEDLMRTRGLTIEPLCREVDIDLQTLRRWRDGKKARIARVKELADFFSVDVKTLLMPDAFTSGATSPTTGSVEWETDGVLEKFRLTSNGLCVVVCRMKHRHIPGRMARGKYYPLAPLPSGMRDRLLPKLVRHAEVCSRIPPHLNIAANLSANFGESKMDWWVIDEWVGDLMLTDLIEQRPLDVATLARVLTGITAGLLQLHSAGIVFRELAPHHVMIRDHSHEPVLTDFELAKLLDGSPSVSTEWREDVFRAPEVDSGVFDVRADYYSLARLAARCVVPDEETQGDVLPLWRQYGMPASVIKWMKQAMSPIPTDRPKSTDPLITELRRWKDKVS